MARKTVRGTIQIANSDHQFFGPGSRAATECDGRDLTKIAIYHVRDIIPDIDEIKVVTEFYVFNVTPAEYRRVTGRG